MWVIAQASKAAQHPAEGEADGEPSSEKTLRPKGRSRYDQIERSLVPRQISQDTAA